MSSEQTKKEFQDFMSGSTVKPPTGSVFDDLVVGGGPPMARMIILQIAFQFLSKFKQLTNTRKAFCIGLVCLGFIYSDMSSFINNRNPNVYNVLGAKRNSDTDFISERLQLAKICDLEMDQLSCAQFASQTQRLNTTEIDEIKFVLVDKPSLRELYDKTEIFLRKKTENTVMNPSQGARYLQSFTELGSYSIFIIMMTLYVEKHQNFARQMTIASLLVFATISFQLKAPKEGDEENTIVWLVNQIPQLDQFTYFELSYMVKTIIYPMVFQAALFMSRMIDQDPIIIIRERLQIAQRILSRSIVLCELITDHNGTATVQVVPDLEPRQELPQLQAGNDNDPIDDDQVQQEIALQGLADFGKANQHVFRAYEWVCNMRKLDTVGYMKDRIDTANKQEKSVSLFGKIGKLIKKLFIIFVVGVMVGPVLYEQFAPMLGVVQDSPPSETPFIQAPPTEQSITKAAQDREMRQNQRQRQKQQEFDDLYDRGQHRNDL